MNQPLMEMADHRERSDLFEGSWNDLPKDMQIKILVLLPVESIYRFRCINKESKAQLSNKFINDIWAKAPVNKEPWLVLCDIFSATPCMAYCFHTRTWKPCFSICRGLRGYHFFHRGSAAGLLLVDKLPAYLYDPLDSFHSAGCQLYAVNPYSPCPLYVYNPLSRTHIKLPRMRFIKTIDVAKLIVQSGSDGNNQENSYNVVAVGYAMLHTGRESAVEIYESCTKSWRIARYLPKEFNVMNDLVFLDATIYCLTTMGILCFSISAAAETPLFFAALPELLRRYSLTAHLIICGSRILIATSTAAQVGVTITIWEIVKDDRLPSFSWKEISTMPLSLYRDFIKSPIHNYFHCVGVGETWVCFKSQPEEQVVVYNLEHQEEDRSSNVVVAYNLDNNSWSQLPRCPKGQGTDERLVAFEPRPNMRVS